MRTWVGRLRYGAPNAVSNAISYAMHRGRSHIPFSCAISFLQAPSEHSATPAGEWVHSSFWVKTPKVSRCVGGAGGQCSTEVA